MRVPHPPSTAPQKTAAMANRAHILVVDDDKRIRTLLSRYLLREGYLVSAAGNAQEATERMRDLAFDLIVLDVMMPGESGTQFAARLRQGPEPLRSAPILMLTALSETANRVEGLEAGVDDYLAKPFDPRELSLRIASILRRARPAEPAITLVRFGDCAFDPERGELMRGRKPVRLTTRERDLLQTLVDHAGAIVSRQTLAKRSAEQKAAERSVDVEIARLRRKIETDPNSPRCLQTVRGQGYRLLVEPPRAVRLQS
ncbi:MAG: DNA-binding response regulator [Methylocystis sp.]|nr:MAG: DNA-binding response regulator [Methylocystis sp.]